MMIYLDNVGMNESNYIAYTVSLFDEITSTYTRY